MSTPDAAFWLGAIIGAVLGGCLGAMFMALLSMSGSAAKEEDTRPIGDVPRVDPAMGGRK